MATLARKILFLISSCRRNAESSGKQRSKATNDSLLMGKCPVTGTKAETTGENSPIAIVSTVFINLFRKFNIQCTIIENDRQFPSVISFSINLPLSSQNISGAK
ncbi:hypothetical protein [Thalassomonas actiniarum]|uniref:Uncharacterized protein n=1 Tax=Thalassomonas actiniarum TaxID=485447 RepID=A0AAE9YMM9_9GAMM|nr:hypothetical protein [Thalassomonas actiniarum]WDD98000.1 hypothetical protein SG35_022375 [Thalassomonas actiniarum]